MRAPSLTRAFGALGPRGIRRLLNVWPPFLGAGIRVLDIGRDWRSARVELRMHTLNRNYVGAHFGGSLFAMTDPFWMLLVLRSLGRDYLVWDRAGAIEFLKPGRGTVHAAFALDEAALDALRAAADGATTGTAPAPQESGEPDDAITVLPSGAVLRWFRTDILDAGGEVVARVRKQVYVRRRAA